MALPEHIKLRPKLESSAISIGGLTGIICGCIAFIAAMIGELIDAHGAIHPAWGLVLMYGILLMGAGMVAGLVLGFLEGTYLAMNTRYFSDPAKMLKRSLQLSVFSSAACVVGSDIYYFAISKRELHTYFIAPLITMIPGAFAICAGRTISVMALAEVQTEEVAPDILAGKHGRYLRRPWILALCLVLAFVWTFWPSTG